MSQFGSCGANNWISVCCRCTSVNISLTVDAGWVVVNLRHEGYFRVNYDEENWNALIGQLNTDHTVSVLECVFVV